MTQGFLQSRSGWPFLTVYNVCFYIIHILHGAQILPLKSRLYFQRALLASQEHQAEGTGISYKPCASTHAQTPHYEHPPADWDICHSEVTSLHVIITQSPEFTSGITLGVVEFMSLDKGTKTCVCHYRILQNVFFGLISNDPPLHDSPPHTPLANTEAFTVSIILSFRDSQVVGIIQCMHFSDWLHSWANMHLHYLQLFPWFDSSLPFHAEW